MNNKVYELLPGHLRNPKLEGYFEATLERAFSKGSVDKTRGYVGRKERGIYKVNQPYVTYPDTSVQRENYSFEPVYSNENIGDNVFYDDLLNALYNKGALTNDHRRLFTQEFEALNIPINKDKFINYEMYYWVEDGFDVSIIGNSNMHYITIARGTLDWWSANNSWYHYNDIVSLLTPSNQDLIHQAKRPIIEFDNRLELSDESFATTYFEIPTFKSFDTTGYQTDVRIFSYVTGDYPYDELLGINPKLVAGDYISEYAFTFDLPEGNYVNLSDGGTLTAYVDSQFDFRNYRQSFDNDETKQRLTLNETPKTGTVEVYIDGIKQFNNFSVSNNIVTLNNATNEYVYVDFCVDGNVTTDAKGSFQRINPSVEYNPEGLSYVNVELTFSNVFEHFVRIIETADGLTGEPISTNNYRDLITYGDNISDNIQGSILIRAKKDLGLGYFTITRDDYDPLLATDFLASAYTNFKNRFVNLVRQTLNSPVGDRTNTDILEEVVMSIAHSRNSVVRIFENSEMIQIGSLYNHYEELTVNNVVGSSEQFMPDFNNPVTFDREVEVYLNGQLQILDIDYNISSTGGEIIFINYVVQTNDVIVVRRYFKSEDSKIPPSATYLGIHPSFIPQIITDNEYDTPVNFIVGHDGSKTAVFGDRTDDILLELEIKMYNYLQTKNTSDVYMDDAVFWNSTNGYSNSEKNYIMYPFFKKWMRKNDIANLFNTNFDLNDWKTWNYKSIDELLPGNWRGIYEYFYGTDQILIEPWRILAVSQKPDDFDTVYGTDYDTIAFWQQLIVDAGMFVPIPVNGDGSLKTIEELLGVTISNPNDLNTDWEFGDRSPVEMTWRRSSDYTFNTFSHRFLQKPFDTATDYRVSIENMIRFFAKRDSLNINNILTEKQGYQFKLGSKLAGFVNNFKLYSENTSLTNSRYTDIPSDNYNLFVHIGEANRSENLSGIVLEKIAINNQYPTYDINDAANYLVGDVVINPYDKKYYKRKTEGATDKEIGHAVNFDYAAWILISQPKVREVGYRVYGYNDLNPVFHTLNWDTASGEKVYETYGDKLNIKNWKTGTLYKVDQYVVYNGSPFVCIEEHQSGTQFDTNLSSWKALREWPRTNKVFAYGYKEVLPTSIKTYNYGDILYNKDEIAQLFIGYQEYLKQVGWDFTDLEDNATVDFETLLLKFLEWSVENHEVGEYISLTPILTSGVFAANMGTPSITRETYKNYFRVIDQDGNKISDKDIDFFISGNTISWKSSTPVYSITVDIADVEHAFVIDREDSYGDTIYNPLTHDRNLRMIVDCNRASNWNGTLEVDGHIVYENKMIPNFETMADEVRYYRDTLVDQSLDALNHLKASQIGFSPRTYLSNMNMERESQLEFYKGFLSEKGTVASINRLVNMETNIKDIEKSDVWALKLSDFGNNKSRKTTSVVRENILLKENPIQIDFNNADAPFVKTSREVDAAVKTSGYVDYKTVSYVVQNFQALESMDTTNIYEGDTAWIQFDEDRDWDVIRLSEIAEIDFVGETSDGQLYIALSNSIDVTETVFLKIQDDKIDPKIKGYFYLVFDEVVNISGLNVYKYLVFETNYEPLIVEIDDLTSNSIIVPSPTDSAIEAIGSKSNPEFTAGEELFIDGVVYTYSDTPSPAYVLIEANENAVDPYVQRGEKIRLVVYNELGAIANSNTTVEFLGTTAIPSGTFTSQVGDQFKIEGVTVTVAPSSISSISITSDNPETTNVPNGRTLDINGNIYTFGNIVVTGTVLNPQITVTKAIEINGVVVTFTVPAPITGSDTTESFTNEPAPVSSVVLTTNMATYQPGDITVNDGTSTYTLGTNDYTYNSGTQTITFDTPIVDGIDADGVVDITVELIAQPVGQPLTLTEIVNIINASTAPVTASNVSGNLQIVHSGAKLTMSGSALIDLGISTNSLYEKSKYDDAASYINGLTSISSFVDGNGFLVINTSLSSLTIGGTAGSIIGIDNGTYNSTVDPTKSSIADQINALLIDSVTATVESGSLIINRNGSSLTLENVTSQALENLGFTTVVNDTIEIDSLQLIVDQINDEIFANTPSIGEALIDNRKLKIISPNRSISISDLVGNPLTDLGITAGTYTSSVYSSSSALKFAIIINESVDNTGVEVSISSDGRMVFKSNNLSMTFSGTSQTILNRIGLYTDYSSVTSNEDYKIMRWKSVRYTPDVNGTTFNQFYTTLGLNDASYIWADDYDDGWAVLYRTKQGVLNVVSRQTERMDTKMMNRVIVRDAENNSHIYDIFDPVNGIFTGEVAKNLDYITWIDPAKYAHSSSTEKWLEDYVGKYWWNTSHSRYYRYHDVGDKNGILDVSIARRYWGKLVEGSEIEVYRWSVDTVIPTDITDFNEYTYYDSAKGTTVTRYYFWAKESVNQDSNEYTPNDMKLLIEGSANKDRFIPIDENSILINVNNANKLVGNEAEYIVDYYVSNERTERHTEWHLLSEIDNKPVPTELYNSMVKSIMDRTVSYDYVSVVTADMIQTNSVVIEGFDVNKGLDISNTVVTVNSAILNPVHFDLNYDNITIWTHLTDVIEGDVIRIYKLDAITDNWFQDVSAARRVFAQVTNEYMKRKFLTGFANNWYEYIAKNDNIFVMTNWSLSEEFDTIEKYGYLSKTLNFDMNSLYDSGVKSFKIEETDYTSYYFEVDGTLRLVNKSDESLILSYSTAYVPNYDYLSYYQNATAVQTYEFMNMMDIYASDKFKKSLFVNVLKYLVSESSHLDWLFKTSYFDLVMMNDRLRQSAVYLRDSFQDMIDYVNETKPYHAKIRETKNIHTTSDTANITADSQHTFNINLNFGKVENHIVEVDAAFVANPVVENIAEKFSVSTAEGTYNVYLNGKLVDTQYYNVVDNDLIFDAFGDILDGSVPDELNMEIGDLITIQKNVSRYNLEITDGNANTDSDNELDGGKLLRDINHYTNLGGGIDTGFVAAFARDIMVVDQTDYTDETRTTEDGKQFYVYDQFGRGYILEVDNTGTINNFDGSTIIVNQQSYFKEAKDDTVRLVLLENTNKKEFILYDKKDGTNLRVKNRGVYTGEMGNFTNGDTIYNIKSVRQI
jgi:hypothetical protein